MTISDLCADDARKMDFLCGDLSPAERQEMEQHLQGCSACRSELDDLSVLSERLKDINVPKCPEGFVASAMASVEAYERLGRRFRRARQMVLAALGVLALISTFVLLRGFQLDPLWSVTISDLSINFEIVRFVVVLALLLGLPACLDGLGFLMVRRRLVCE